MQVKARVPKLNLEVAVEYNFGENLNEAVGTFGEDVVFNTFVREAVVGLQSFVRRQLTKEVEGEVVETGITQDELQAKVNEWKPGIVTRTKKSKIEKMADQTKDMSEEELRELLSMVKSQMK